MARHIIANIDGAVATAHAPSGELLGVIEYDTTAPALARPVVAPAPVLPNGVLPVTVTYPDDATSVVLWVPTMGIFRPMVSGVNFLRQSDLGYDTTVSSICALFEARGPSDATSNWIPRQLVWKELIEAPRAAVPVMLASAGSLVTTGTVAGGVVANFPTWNGDFSATENFIFTSATSGGTPTSTGTIWATIPNLAGAFFRLGSRAFGPRAADPTVNGWTDWVYTDPIEILPAPVPEPFKLEADDVTIVSSSYRPGGQTTNFTPLVRFSGLVGQTVHAIEFTAADPNTVNPTWNVVTPHPTVSGDYELFDRNDPVPPPPYVDGSLFQAGSARLNRLSFRWRISADGAWSERSVLFTVPEPVVTPVEPLKAIFNPTLAVANDAVINNAVPYQDYRIMLPPGNGGGNPSTIRDKGTLSKWDTFVPMLYTWAGNTGNLTIQGNAKAAVRQNVDQLLRWASDAGDTAPACRSGYHGQHEMRFVATVALARITPAVWDHADLNAFAKYKTRLDLMMKLCLVANAVIASDTIPFDPGFGLNRERSLRGYTAGRSNVPNFSSPPHLTPHVVAAYMAENGESAQTFIANFNRANFSAQMEAVGGMNEARATIAQQWTRAYHVARYGRLTEGKAGVVDGSPQVGPGHSAAEITYALTRNGNGPWRSHGGHTLTQTREAFARELRDRTFSATVKPGVLNAQKPAGTYWGAAGPAGSGWAGNLYGVLTGPNRTEPLSGCLGAPLANGTTSKAAWAGLPNPGAVGMHFELEATDGGGTGPAVRSGIAYALGGLGPTMMAFITLICYGKFDANDAIWDAVKPRFEVCIRDLNYRRKYGHRSYDKGEAQEVASPAWWTANVKWVSFMAMMDMVAEWWGLDPFPTDD